MIPGMNHLPDRPPPLPRRPLRRGWRTAAVILGTLLAVSLLFNLALAAARRHGAVARSSAYGGSDEFPRLTEQWSYGRGPVKAVRIPLQGVIVRQESLGLFGGAIDKIRGIHQQIQAATHDEDVRCILLEVDSPGGGVSPSDELYHALMRFKQSRGDRAVIAFTRDMAASGGYYAALAADWIIAEPTAVVGSIGVLMQSLNWQKLADTVGVRDITIRSGGNKDMLNPFREASEQQIGLLQEMVDGMHDRFTGLVGARRNLDGPALDEVVDGRIFTADQALDHGLIDQVGYWDDAVDRTRQVLGVSEVKFVRYTRPTDLFSLLTQIRAPTPAAWSAAGQAPRMLYLWRQ